MPWFTITDSFDADFGVDEWHGHNVFIREGDQVFRTYFINNRGDEAVGTVWSYLDLAPLAGRALALRGAGALAHVLTLILADVASDPAREASTASGFSAQGPQKGGLPLSCLRPSGRIAPVVLRSWPAGQR